MNSGPRALPNEKTVRALLERFGPNLAVHPGVDLPLPSGARVIDYHLSRLRPGGELREVVPDDGLNARVLIEAAAFDPVDQLHQELSVLASSGNPALQCAVLVRERKRFASIRRVIAEHFATVEERLGGGVALLVGAGPLDALPPVAVTHIEVVDPRTQTVYRLETAPGLFSGNALDQGTAILLRLLPWPFHGRAMDVGSGYGPLTVALAGRGLDTTYVDVDARALRMTGHNLAMNKLSATALASKDLGEVAPGSFDLIVSNPPTHAGSEVLRTLFSAMAASLSARGRMMIVVREHLNYEKWLKPLGRLLPAEIEAGYKVLTVLPRR